MRNLAGQLLMSGTDARRMGQTINDALYRKNTELQASVNQALITHQALQQQSQMIKEQGVDATFITGQSIDAFYNRKQNKLTNAELEIKDLKRENEQLNKLNEKLVQKAEELQQVIEQEASAHSYYYNYPPKTDD